LSSEDVAGLGATIQTTRQRTSELETLQKGRPKRRAHSGQLHKASAKPTSKIETSLPRIELPEEATGLFHRNYERILVDDSLSDKDVILLALYLLERENKRAGVRYTECKQLFMFLGRKGHPNFSVNVHNAIKERLIEQQNSDLFFLGAGLKRVQDLLGLVQKKPVFVIKSGQSFTALKRLEEFLMQEVQSQDLLLCDSYVSSSTLFPLSVLTPKLKSIKILTFQVQDGDKFREYTRKLQKETGILIEVKVSNKIHDRYLITGDKCWSFGASIKDLGNKDTIIREISEVTESMREIFLERWNESPDFA